MRRIGQAFRPTGARRGREGVRLAALLLAVAAGCGAEDRDPGAVEIAQVDGRPVLLRDFEPVLRANGDTAADALPDTVKSRLLDQFLERQVLLAEARKRGLEVAPQDLELSLARDRQTGASDAYRERRRDALLVEKLVRQVVEESAEKRYYEEHPELFQRPAVLVLRQILLDEPAEAAAVREEIMAAPENFIEVARRVSQSPDQGFPRAYSADELPREALEILRTLKPGGVSPVVELPPTYLIFQLEELRPERRVPLEEARGPIRARLQEAQGSGVLARLLAELKTQMGVQMYKGELPFRYIQEEPA